VKKDFRWHDDRGAYHLTTDFRWLVTLRIYIATTVTAHMIWEVVQLPLYTIWSTGTPHEIIFTVVHCIGGDFMISTLSLIAALLIFGDCGWPNERFISVMIAALIMGLGTLFIASGCILWFAKPGPILISCRNCRSSELDFRLCCNGSSSLD